MLMEMLEKINLNCAYCGKHLGIAYVEKSPEPAALLAYCCAEHDEADTAKGVEQAMKTVRRIMAENAAQKKISECASCPCCGKMTKQREGCDDDFCPKCWGELHGINP